MWQPQSKCRLFDCCGQQGEDVKVVCSQQKPLALAQIHGPLEPSLVLGRHQIEPLPRSCSNAVCASPNHHFSSPSQTQSRCEHVKNQNWSVQFHAPVTWVHEMVRTIAHPPAHAKNQKSSPLDSVA